MHILLTCTKIKCSLKASFRLIRSTRQEERDAQMELERIQLEFCFLEFCHSIIFIDLNVPIKFHTYIPTIHIKIL